MKRIFALALALIMALGMMVMTASAESIYCPDHPVIDASCTEHSGTAHYYIYEITGDTVKYCYFYPDNDGFGDDREKNMSYFTERGLTPEVGMLVWVDMEGGCIGVCKRLGAPAAQPKTGVMDTLPLWFGVMAVSACAYVLTSKKRVF